MPWYGEMIRDTDDIEANWAYLAGILDGEGSFGVYSAGTRLTISNTCLPLIEWCAAFVGEGYINKVQSAGAKRQCYQWNCGAVVIRRILPRMIPYMIVKHRKAVLFMEYLNGITPNSAAKLTDEEIARRARLIEEMRSCMEGREWAARQGH